MGIFELCMTIIFCMVLYMAYWSADDHGMTPTLWAAVILACVALVIALVL